MVLAGDDVVAVVVVASFEDEHPSCPYHPSSLGQRPSLTQKDHPLQKGLASWRTSLSPFETSFLR